MASRKYGALLTNHKTPDSDITKDVPDSTEITDDVTLKRLQQPLHRKESVVRMTLSGINYVVETVTRHILPEVNDNNQKSRSFPPRVRTGSSSCEQKLTGTSTINIDEQTNDEDEEDLFFSKPLPSPSSPILTASNDNEQQLQMSIDERTIGDGKIDDGKSLNFENTGIDCDNTDASDLHMR